MATVLVVDDEADLLELIRINLEFDGHRVLTAQQGDEVMDKVRRHRPDIVLLDVMMPGLDGFSVLSKIKAEADVATIPVMMVTARAAAEDRIRGGIEGAVRYLTKPFSPAELRQEVRAALDGEPEPAKRHRVQTQSLEALARLEKGSGVTDLARPHLTKLDGPPKAEPDTLLMRSLHERISTLTEKQRELLVTLRDVGSVSEAATRLGVSRSNIYSSLQRIGRRLGARSVPDLLALVRSGELVVSAPEANGNG